MSAHEYKIIIDHGIGSPDYDRCVFDVQNMTYFSTNVIGKSSTAQFQGVWQGDENPNFN